MTLGKVQTLLGDEVTEGGLVHAFHRLGALCEKTRPTLIEDYRQAKAKHADETGWRTDGHSGYAWLFCSATTSIFEFRETRAGRVAKEILGDETLPGVLTVDRYRAYNRMPCQLQYCYAHLLREVEKLEDEFSNSQEVTKFVAALATELSKAMKLRGLGLELQQYRDQAQQIRAQIEQIVDAKAEHLGVRRIQTIFKDNRDRLYQWVEDPEISPENNRAERELRPTVVARKVSFGSQSKRGAKTRSQIMSVLWTVKKRFPNQTVEAWLTDALQKIAANPSVGLADLLALPNKSTPSN
jgi:transposase